MHALKTRLKHAQKWKEYVIDKKLLDKTQHITRDDSHIYFPLVKMFDVKDATASIVDYAFEKRKKTSGKLREHLFGKLSPEEKRVLRTGHDIIGTIAIIEIPESLLKHEKLMAETLLSINPNIKTVLKKSASHEGVFRTQKMTYLAGIETKEATYKENGITLVFDVEKVYFSIRLSTERKRIMAYVKNGEEILVMFSGCAPYPVVLAKNTDAKHITGIEINPEGHRYGLENVKRNKIRNVELINDDVHHAIPLLHEQKKTYDRIIMPLPKTADEFLSDALLVAKKGTIIHFYDFLPEDQFDEAKQKIADACKHAGLKHKILRVVKCGQHSPHVFRICVDFEII